MGTETPWLHVFLGGFPGGSAGKESACSAGDLGSIPGLGRSPGKGKGYRLQYSGLENSMDTVHGVAKSRTRLSDFHSVQCIPRTKEIHHEKHSFPVSLILVCIMKGWCAPDGAQVHIFPRWATLKDTISLSSQSLWKMPGVELTELDLVKCLSVYENKRNPSQTGYPYRGYPYCHQGDGPLQGNKHIWVWLTSFGCSLQAWKKSLHRWLLTTRFSPLYSFFGLFLF